jgi:hypothetical protein
MIAGKKQQKKRRNNQKRKGSYNNIRPHIDDCKIKKLKAGNKKRLSPGPSSIYHFPV